MPIPESNPTRPGAGLPPSEAERERLLARLEELVRLESPAGDASAVGPVIASLAARWSALGAAVRQIPTEGGPCLIADLPGTGGAPLLLVGHADTVWPIGALEGEVPWRRDDGVIRGPGAFDMKSGLVIIEHLLERVASTAAPHTAVRVFVACDEETGSRWSGPVLAEAAEGCRAAIGFESPHPDGGFKVGRLGSVRARLVVGGRAAHAALDPESGISATEELVDQLRAVRALVAAAPVDPELGPVLYNLGALEAPGRSNVVADRAEALLGFRFADPAQEDAVLGGIRALRPVRAGATLELVIESHRPAWARRPEDQALADALTPAGGPIGRPAAGAADTNLLGRAPFPVVDGFGPRGGGAHAASEHLDVGSFFERCTLLVDAVLGGRI